MNVQCFHTGRAYAASNKCAGSAGVSEEEGSLAAPAADIVEWGWGDAGR